MHAQQMLFIGDVCVEMNEFAIELSSLSSSHIILCCSWQKL